MMSTRMGTISWLLFLYGLPAESKTARVRLWRKLKKFGAVQRISAYILPNEPAHLERFQWLAKQVRDEGGDASVIEAAKIEGVSVDEIIALFQADREEDYKELAVEIQASLKGAKVGSSQFTGAIEKLQRRFREIKAIDYFDSPKARPVEKLLQQIVTRSEGGPPRPARPLDKAKFRGKTWLTRPRPEVDRVATAWLVKKFIDPAAKFVFANKPADFPRAIPFDMPDVEFTHQGEDCTFETLLRRFTITDQALKAIGEMVHDADLEDSKFGRVECIGLETAFKGLGNSRLSDREILASGFVCFDGLYSFLK